MKVVWGGSEPQICLFFKKKIDVSLICGSVVMNLPPMQEMQEIQVRSPGWEDPPEEDMATHSSILDENFHRQRSLVGYSP